MTTKTPTTRRVKFIAHDVGLLLRGDFRRHLKEACFRSDVELDLSENKGWLASTFYGTLDGPRTAVDTIQAWMLQVCSDFGDSGP